MSLPLRHQSISTAPSAERRASQNPSTPPGVRAHHASLPPLRPSSTTSAASVTLPAAGTPPPPAGSGGLRLPSNRKSIYDRHLNRSRMAELSKAGFAYLFSEMVVYAQRRVRGVQDLEKRLNEQGYPLGLRLLDLLLYRSLPSTSHYSSSSSSSTSTSATGASTIRPLRIVSLLHLIHGPLWRLLFSRDANGVERSVSPTTPNEFMITDNDPVVNSYISVPRELSMLNCAAYVAGIIEGVCDGCGFEASVSAHNQGTDLWPNRTVFLLRFGEGVMEREQMLDRVGVKP